jgi:hypothetical protein
MDNPSLLSQICGLRSLPGTPSVARSLRLTPDEARGCATHTPPSIAWENDQWREHRWQNDQWRDSHRSMA